MAKEIDKKSTLGKKSKKSKEVKTLADQFNRPQTTGRRKPGRVSYQQLRNIAQNNDLISTVVTRLKKSVVKVPWHIRPKGFFMSPDEKQKAADNLKPEIEYVTDLLRRPNSNDDTFRTLFIKVLDDILVLDNGVTEKVKNVAGAVIELYQVDGSTIRPNVDAKGLYKNDAYLQYVSTPALFGSITTRKADVKFQQDELLIFQENPSGVAGRTGYGMSPVELIVYTALTSINAMVYNADFFDGNKVPPFMFNLEGVGTDEVLAFKTQFEEQMSGNAWSAAFTNAANLQAQSLRPNNQEMQFYQLNLWLARIIFAAFGVAPQDLGFTMETNKATAQVQRDITKAQGVAFLLDVLAEEINEDLIMDLEDFDPRFGEIEFAWDNQDKLDAKTQAEIDEIYLKNGKTHVNEIRIRDGEKAYEFPEANVPFGTIDADVDFDDPDKKEKDAKNKKKEEEEEE